MAEIIGWAVGLALIGLIGWATVAMAGGRGRTASRRRGGVQMMAAMLFGFGAALDPPQRHVAEAKDETPKGSPETGEPELDP
jgi:heme A synthase